MPSTQRIDKGINTTVSQDDLKPGMRLGGFELLAPIGKGGMANVWVASGEALGAGSTRLFAVKIMHPQLVGDPAFHEMFLAEGRLIRSIQHSHVVRVFDVGVVKQHLYIAMEWVEGASLHTLIAEANKRRPIPIEMAVRLIADTAAGLHAAHEVKDESGNPRGVVHCDVSPHNILVGVRRGVKLVDFGVASTINHLAGSPSSVRGKFAYMSPEQTRAAALDRRSDIFSLGIVLFELTTGFRLFRGDTPHQAIDLVRNGPIVDPRELRDDYPPVLAEIVLKALQRAPEDRFQTAELFQRALESYLLAERIVVPSAGINGLLQRVLGDKIQRQRARIQAAAKALGAEHALPSSPAPTEPAPALPTDDSVGAVSTLAPPKRPPRLRLTALATFSAVAASAAGFLWALSPGPAPKAIELTGAAPSALTAALEPGPRATSPAQAGLAVAAAEPAQSAASSVPALALTALPKASIEEEPLEPDSPSPTSTAVRTSRAGGDTQRLTRAAASMGQCSRGNGPRGAGTVRLSVTSSGKVVAASVSKPFFGTAVGACVISRYQGLRLSAGEARTLTRTFRIP